MSHKLKKTAFVIIPDTNAIFCENKSVFVNKSFETGLESCRKLADVRLLIPKVVFEERLFRISNFVKQQLKNAAGNLDSISKLTKIESPVLISSEQALKHTRKSFDGWCKSNNAEILPIPIDKIDWLEVVNDALWRNPPFVFEENSKTEKGFRDCLIVQTLKEFKILESCESAFFISNDELLCDVVRQKCVNKKWKICKDLESFHSYLKLLDDEFDKEFVGSILDQANLNFINKYFADLKIEEHIETQFFAHFICPQEKGVAGQTILPSIFWQKISPRKPFVCETQYNKKIGEGVFEWVTRVEFVDLFKQSPPTDNLFLPNERIRISKFDVIWTAEISDSREFSNPKLSGIKLSEGFLEYPLFSTKACYGFLSENQSDFFQANNLGLSGFNASETGNLLKNLLGEFTTPPNVITPPKFEQ